MTRLLRSDDMGVGAVTRIRAGGPRLIVDRPWADKKLDDAVTAVRDGLYHPAVAVLAETRMNAELRSLRVEALATAAIGASGVIESLLADDRGNPDLWLWLGRTRVEEAWRIKPDERARAVQAHRHSAFQRAMDAARWPLLTAASLMPSDPVPWEAMMWVAIGLDRPRPDKDAVWIEVTRRSPLLFSANVARLMTLSPTWGGTAREMFAFARSVAARATQSDPLPALVPLAHFERGASERGPMSRGGWFSGDALREIVAAAAQWWQWGTHPRTILAHNVFGAAFYAADMRRPARGHLIRTMGRGSRVPWSHLGDPAHQYQRACERLHVPLP